MRFTILGSAGFIGRHMTGYLRSRGHNVLTPARDVDSLRGIELGHVIYAIGVTGNFRQAPDAAIEAHVNVLRRLMNGADFESWLYLSSTRVYGGMPAGAVASENAPVPVISGADSLYDLSKLLGEAVCLGANHDKIRVARLSNVYGKDQSEHTFLGSVISDLRSKGRVVIGESPSSAKDYVSIDDVTVLLTLIAERGRERLYNIASGQLVEHGRLADVIRACGYDVNFAPAGPERIFPTIDVSRIKSEFGCKMRSMIEDISDLIKKEKV